jgi:predicted ATP-grasp superfamily ATP-dependent carboligase
VLTENEAFVMEVNPRLTTSYVGLRRVARFNVAEALIQSVTQNKLPADVPMQGYACFSKTPISGSVSRNWTDICKLTEVVSPPFPVDNTNTSYALVESYGNSPRQVQQMLRDAQSRLLQTCQGGGQPR